MIKGLKMRRSFKLKRATSIRTIKSMEMTGIVW